MSSRSSKKIKRQSCDKKITMPPDDGIGNEDFNDNSPTSVYNNPTHSIIPGTNLDATTAPEIGEDEENKGYTQTPAALFDKYLLSGKGIYAIFILLILAISGFIFIQDNGANKLNGWSDILWSIQKCSFFWLLFIIYIIIQLIARIFNCIKSHLKNKKSIKVRKY